MTLNYLKGFFSELEKIAKKKDNMTAGKAAKIGAGAAVVGGTALSIAKQEMALRAVKNAPNYKKSNAFFNRLQPGDVILHSDYSDRHGVLLSRETALNLQKKTTGEGVVPGLKKTLLKNYKAIKHIKVGDVIQGATGGSPYTHASLYTGNGKVLETTSHGKVKTYNEGGDIQNKQRMVALRATDDPKMQQKIVDEGLKTKGIKYPKAMDTVKRQLLKNSIGCGYKSNELVCSGVPATAVEKATKKRISKLVPTNMVDPSDLLASKHLKPVVGFNTHIPLGKAERLYQVGGNVFKNLKVLPVGAAAGLAAYSIHKAIAKKKS